LRAKNVDKNSRHHEPRRVGKFIQGGKKHADETDNQKNFLYGGIDSIHQSQGCIRKPEIEESGTKSNN
jgi:hypothetical protein